MFRSRDSSANSRGSNPEEIDIPPPIRNTESNQLPEIPGENDEKNFTNNHPLGRMLLSLAAQGNELSKKSNCLSNMVDLNELCATFKNSIQMDKNS